MFLCELQLMTMCHSTCGKNIRNMLKLLIKIDYDCQTFPIFKIYIKINKVPILLAYLH